MTRWPVVGFPAASRQLDLPLAVADDAADDAAPTQPVAARQTGAAAQAPAWSSAQSQWQAQLPSPLQSPTSKSAAAAPAASPDVPDAPVAPATTPSRFEHPHASREIALGQAVVAYEFRRARRRSIGMVVSADGLSVRAPRWVGTGEVEAALRAKSAWIQAKLVEQRERARRHAAARIDWRDGATLPFLGDTLVLVLDPCAAAGAVLRAAPLPAPPGSAARRALHVGLPPTAPPEQIRDVVQAWLRHQARRVFEERCAHFAPRLGVQVRRLAISAAQTRWGSASADGSVRLNWRLVHFALPTIDYVVAHELSHLREMNHSARFWAVVRSVVPDLEAARGALRREVLPALD